VALISQDAKELGLEWVQGDPISLHFIVETVDWTGTYIAQVRRRQNPTSELFGTLVVTATFTAGVGTAFTLSMSTGNSAHVPAGDLYWDLQQVGGVTRLRGIAHVVAQVTV
jgi:hypothetical protein